MKNQQKKYPSKILLFGEYTVLSGGGALAIPYELYYGYWSFLREGEVAKYDLLPFIAYLSTCSFLNQFNLEAFTNDVHNGLVFQSNIPTGYGAGSSGALCAGIWDKYGEQVEVHQLQDVFVEMESFFHGKSSGLDPLVSYFDRPFCISDGALLPQNKLERPKQIKIFDSKINRKTEPLVNWYKREMTQNNTFRKAVLERLMPLNKKGIEAVLEKNDKALECLFKEISEWQLQEFSRLIPDTVKSYWIEAQQRGVFLKLCGAGGGGFFLELHSSMRDY